MAKEAGVQVVDYKIMDIPGTLQHISYHIDGLKESTFENGIGFDGSSIRGFQAIHESDMLLLPDPTSAVLDPFRQYKTLNLTFDSANSAVYTPQLAFMENGTVTYQDAK